MILVANAKTEVQRIFDNVGADGVIGSYMVIAEVLRNGHLELDFFASRGMTPWTASGMLAEVIASIPEVEINSDFEGEDWDEWEGEDDPPF